MIESWVKTINDLEESRRNDFSLIVDAIKDLEILVRLEKKTFFDKDILDLPEMKIEQDSLIQKRIREYEKDYKRKIPKKLIKRYIESYMS